MWANGSQIRHKNYCIAANSKANQVLDIDVTMNERMAKDSEPMSSDNLVIFRKEIYLQRQEPSPG